VLQGVAGALFLLDNAIAGGLRVHEDEQANVTQLNNAQTNDFFVALGGLAVHVGSDSEGQCGHFVVFQIYSDIGGVGKQTDGFAALIAQDERWGLFGVERGKVYDDGVATSNPVLFT